MVGFQSIVMLSRDNKIAKIIAFERVSQSHR